MPAVHHWAASECQNEASTLWGPSQLPVVLGMSQWHQATALAIQVAIHTSGEMHSQGVTEAGSGKLPTQCGKRRVRGRQKGTHSHQMVAWGWSRAVKIRRIMLFMKHL